MKGYTGGLFLKKKLLPLCLHKMTGIMHMEFIAIA